MSQIKIHIYIYTHIKKKKKKEIFFLPNMVHNEARSLLVLSSTMPDEYICICRYICVCSLINKAPQWLLFSLPSFFPSSLFACVQFGRANFFFFIFQMRMEKNERWMCMYIYIYVCVCSLDLNQIARMYKKSNKYLIRH